MVEIAKTMNLIALNDDCLLSVFSNLDENDLASVSDVCKRFQQQAALTFSRKFKNEHIFLRNLTPKRRSEASRILRVFGHLMQKAYLVFEYKKNDLFFNHVIEKCGSNLIDIKFSCTASWTTKHKKSENVLKNDILMKFQNLKRLSIDVAANVDPECIEEKFPALEHLSLDCGSFENANLRIFVKLNPQLKSLELTHDPDGIQIRRTFLAFIDRNLPYLEHFGLSGSPGWSLEENLPSEPLFFKNLKSLFIKDSRGRAKFFPYLAISNIKIEEMEFHVYRCDVRLVDQICQYQQLKKLTFYCDEDSGMDSSDLDKFSEKLVHLTEVELSGYYDDLYEDAVVKFVKNSKHLRRFFLQDFGKGYDMMEYSENVKDKFSASEWKVICRPEDFCLEIRKLKI